MIFNLLSNLILIMIGQESLGQEKKLESKWETVCKSKKKNKMSKLIIPNEESDSKNKKTLQQSSDQSNMPSLEPNLEPSLNPRLDLSPTETQNKIDNGDSVKLPNNYVLWRHDINNKDWTINGYKILCRISNVSEFWKLFNNFDKLGLKFNNFFLMKDGIPPIWEHENNRNGGICSMKTEIENAIKTFEELAVYLCSNNLNNDMSDINGISISPKNNWAILKIWNRDKSKDLTGTLNQNIITKYQNMSIKYKSNEPEY